VDKFVDIALAAPGDRRIGTADSRVAQKIGDPLNTLKSLGTVCDG
jgi:hypothetical protein